MKSDYDRAIADYSQAIRLNPNSGGAFFLRALSYSQKGDFDRAIQDYTKAIMLDPKLAFRPHEPRKRLPCQGR
jgi:tetratricopeptide (TPR) repeat protein